MPAWGNTDNHNQKPKWDSEREVRQVVSLTTASQTNAGNTTVSLVYNDGAQNNVANIGVAIGQYVYFVSGLDGNGTPGFFESNTKVQSISGNTVTLTNPAFATIPTGVNASFDTAIVYNSNKTSEVNYNADTVLVTPTRLANAVYQAANSQALYANGGVVAHTGWNKITTGTGGRAGRVQTEVLVALANPVAANTLSGNTSNSGTYLSGL